MNKKESEIDKLDAECFALLEQMNELMLVRVDLKLSLIRCKYEQKEEQLNDLLGLE